MKALRKQVAYMSASVIDHLTHDRWLAAVHAVVLQESGPAHVHFDLQLHAKLTAVSQDRRMNRRQTSGAKILVVTLVPCAGLRRAIQKTNFVPPAHRPVAPTSSLSRF